MPPRPVIWVPFLSPTWGIERTNSHNCYLYSTYVLCDRILIFRTLGWYHEEVLSFMHEAWRMHGQYNGFSNPGLCAWADWGFWSLRSGWSCTYVRTEVLLGPCLYWMVIWLRIFLIMKLLNRFPATRQDLLQFPNKCSSSYFEVELVSWGRIKPVNHQIYCRGYQPDAWGARFVYCGGTESIKERWI